MPDHKFHGHEAVYFTNEKKEDKPNTVAGPFIIGTNEGIMEMKFDEKKQQGKARSAYHGSQYIKAKQIAGMPTRNQLEKAQHHKVLSKKYGDGYYKNV